MKLLKDILHLVFPQTCDFCKSLLQADDCFICKRCSEKIQFIDNHACSKCFKPGIINICSDCVRDKKFFKRAVSVAVYDGMIKRCLHKAKYFNNIQAYLALLPFLHRFVCQNEIFKKINTITYIPSRQIKIRQFTNNKPMMFAKYIASTLKKPCIEFLLKKRNIVPQTLLTKTARIKNVKTAFTIINDNAVIGKKILIVDDIYTTGSTLNECSKILLEAGAAEIYCLTIARGR